MKYEVWEEGFAITGNHATACFRGTSAGDTFDDAAIKLLENKLDKDPEEKDGYRRMGGRLCIWGCCLYDNEADARASFG